MSPLPEAEEVFRRLLLVLEGKPTALTGRKAAQRLAGELRRRHGTEVFRTKSSLECLQARLLGELRRRDRRVATLLKAAAARDASHQRLMVVALEAADLAIEGILVAVGAESAGET